MRVITYGRFDILHVGHINLIDYCKSLGEYIIIGLSTDKYAEQRGKACINSWDNRYKLLMAIRGVDLIIPEDSYWDEKVNDIKELNIGAVVIGEEYISQADMFSRLCKVYIHRRTPCVSSSEIRLKMSRQ